MFYTYLNQGIKYDLLEKNCKCENLNFVQTKEQMRKVSNLTKNDLYTLSKYTYCKAILT